MLAQVTPTTSLQSVDIIPALLLGVFGIAIGMWFTRVFWMDAGTGEATTLWNRIQAGVLFILSGTVPGAVQAVAFSKVGGVLSIAGFYGGYGVGLLIGYFRQERIFAPDIFASALSFRIRAGAGNPTPVEVFAFATKFGTPKACSLLHLTQNEFEPLYKEGIQRFEAVKASITDWDFGLVLEVLCGVPVTEVARSSGKSIEQLTGILARALP